jgi:hypothetical protein
VVRTRARRLYALRQPMQHMQLQKRKDTSSKSSKQFHACRAFSTSLPLQFAIV